MTGNIGSSNSFARFMRYFQEELESAVMLHPDRYHYPLQDVPAVCARMRVALRKKAANIDSPSFKAACKRMGIKHTHQAIYNLFENPNPTEFDSLDGTT